MDCQRKPNEPLRFVYTVNRDFVGFALVSILSVIKSATTASEFHVVHDGDLPEDDQAQIRKFVSGHASCVWFYRVPESFPRAFADHSSWDVSVLFRLALTEILPASIDRVMYLDADTLVRQPLDEVFQIDLGASGLGAVPESHPAVERLGLPREAAYLNSGVLAIDLKTWRENQSGQAMLERVMQQPDRWVYPDQDILAVQFAEGWTRLPPEFNVTHRFFSGPTSLPLPTAEPHVIHFSGQGGKPWQTHRHHPYADEFWSVAEAVRQAGFAIPQRPQKRVRWYRRGPVAAYRKYRQRVRQQRRDEAAAQRQSRRAMLQARDRDMVHQFANDLVVRRGPFTGLRYPDAYSHGSTLAPKLLGTYEAELQPTMQRFLQKDYSLIIDVGGAEGYYAVGCALRWPNAQVVAYELGREARAAIREMAAANGVADQIKIEAECMFGDLYGRRGLVICDIEGGEADLLTAEHAAEGFRNSDFLIETHDLFRPDICQQLYQQFSQTHHVTVINAVMDEERPDQWSLPELAMLSPQRQAQIIGERRAGPMQWLVCESKHEFPTREVQPARAA